MNVLDHVRLGDVAVVGEADLDDVDDRERLLLHIPVWPVLNEGRLVVQHLRGAGPGELLGEGGRVEQGGLVV